MPAKPLTSVNAQLPSTQQLILVQQSSAPVCLQVCTLMVITHTTILFITFSTVLYKYIKCSTLYYKIAFMLDDFTQMKANINVLSMFNLQ